MVSEVEAPIIKLLVSILLVGSNSSGQTAPSWTEKFQSSVLKAQTHAGFPIGVYVKDLGTKLTYKLNTDRKWYLASAVKFLIAIEILTEVMNKQINLNDEVLMVPADIRDGSHAEVLDQINKKVTVQFLLENMLIHSDNTASDRLVKLVGIAKINSTVKALEPIGFSEITNLLDVRKMAFSELHTLALGLTNFQFVKILESQSPNQRVIEFQRTIKIPKNKWKTQSLRDGFEKYYSKGLNSSTLDAYTSLLEKTVEERILDAEHTKLLIGIMSRCETGKNRIKAALGAEGFSWAHKTGTQFARVCDIGILTKHNVVPEKKIIFGICAEKFWKRTKAEKLIRDLTLSLISSGIFDDSAQVYGIERPRK